MEKVVVKRDGRIESYDRQKIRSSLLKCTNPRIAERVICDLEGSIVGKVNSYEIHENVKKSLWKRDPVGAVKYQLRESMMKLGPAGYNFEDFYARIIKESGYEPLVRQRLSGRCVIHELDVVYSDAGGKRFAEMKYHNQFGIYTGLKEALYTYMRLLDLNEANNGFAGAELVSNTKVSDDAIDFAKCRKMGIIAWKYPPGNGLEVVIERMKLYPVTSFEGLIGEWQVKKLMSEGVITVKDVVQAHHEGKLEIDLSEVYQIAVDLLK
ncbi:MAG: ATP cone domain-containing protein [Conexivisphaerales archaeon]